MCGLGGGPIGSVFSLRPPPPPSGFLHGAAPPRLCLVPPKPGEPGPPFFPPDPLRTPGRKQIARSLPDMASPGMALRLEPFASTHANGFFVEDGSDSGLGKQQVVLPGRQRVAVARRGLEPPAVDDLDLATDVADDL